MWRAVLLLMAALQCTDVETGAVCAHYTALPPRAADADKSKTLTILEEHGAIAVGESCARPGRAPR
jgi:hypothetical protein